MTTAAQTPEAPPLHVALVAPAPHLPLILCTGGFMATLATVEAQTKELAVIKDAVGNQSAANLLSRATKAGTDLNRQRLELVRPYQDQIDAINLLAKQPGARLDAVKASLKVSQTNFVAEQRRLAEDAERARQAELRRLESIRLQEEAAAKKKAEEIAEQVRKVQEAAKSAGLPLETELETEIWDELPPEVPQKTETERQIEAIKFAPAVVVAKAAGVREVTSLVPFVTDVNKLPDIFVEKTAKIAVIRSVYCAGHKKGDALPVLDGCRFEEQTTTVSTGRSAF